MATDCSFSHRVPDGDNRERQVCDHCGWIHYDNPKIVVGAVPIWDGRVLLCKRAIEPRRGYWNIPAGFLEQLEAPDVGAIRETREEACAEITIDQLLGVYSVPRISQIQMIYRASLVNGQFAAGEESLDVDLFPWEDIPWKELAFPSNHWALRDHHAVLGQHEFAVHHRTLEGLLDEPPDFS